MIKNIITVLGFVFLLVGIMGFFQNPVLGIFAVDPLHNLIHLTTGVLLVTFGLSGEGAARGISKVLGFVYALVGIVGLATGDGTVLGLFTANAADHLLHLVFAVIFLALGYAPATYSRPASFAR